MGEIVHYRKDNWEKKFICGISVFSKRWEEGYIKSSRTYHSNPKKVTCKNCKRILGNKECGDEE